MYLPMRQRLGEIEEAFETVRLQPEAARHTAAVSVQWEFASPDGKDQLQVDRLDWTDPASLNDATLIKENVQRQVWRIMLGGTAYYVKLYLRYGRWWFLKRFFRGPACLKEWRVAHYAFNKGVNCVRPVAYAISTDPGSFLDCLLVTRGLPQTSSLTEYWQRISENGASKNSPDIRRLEDALAKVLAKAHHAGITHCDLHPGNLLVETSNGQTNVYLVDLHSVKTGRPVCDRIATQNLAQLNQWFRQNATLTQRMSLLKRYLVYHATLRSSDGTVTPQTFRRWVQMLNQTVRHHAHQLLASRDRRVMRTSKYFAKLKLDDHWRGHVFLQSKRSYPSSQASNLEFTPEDWRQALAQPEAMIESLLSQSRPIKHSRSTLVCKGTIHLGPHEVAVVCKRQIRRKRLAAIWDCLRYSRCVRAWKVSFAMLHRSLPVAQPLAVLERRIGPYLADSLLITEEVKPSVNLRVFLTTILPVLEAPRRRQVTRVLMEQLQHLLRQMYRYGFVHRDLKATNILIHGMTVEDCRSVDPATLKLVLVDLDGLRLKRRSSHQDLTRAMARLSISADLSPHITQTDRARFLQDYLTRFGSGDPDWKTLWQQIQTERENRFQDHLAG